MIDPETIIQGIDDGLDEAHIIFLGHDLRMNLEDSVWLDLKESVDEGWRTQEEAEDLFMRWRHDHLDVRDY